MGHSWFATPNHIKNGTWCPTCNGQEKKDLEDCQE